MRFYIILNCIMGCLGGVGQICLRSLITYSSLNHLAWLLRCIHISRFFWLKYFIIYIIIFFNLIIFLFKRNLILLSQIIRFNFIHFMVIILLLTISGLPPFFIFLIKFIILRIFIKIRYFLFIFFLIMRSFISLFYYIRFRIYMFLYLNFKKFSVIKNTGGLIW